MTKRTKIFTIVAVAILLAVGGVWFLRSRGAGEGGFQMPGFLSFLSGGDKESSEESSSSEEQIYIHPDYGFIFRYPAGFTATEFSDDAGSTVLVRNPNAEKQEFQIYVSPFDEEGPITPARIQQDLPDMKIEEPMDAEVGEGEKFHALIFWSDAPEFGRTREVWFSQRGDLYQITAYADADTVVAGVMETWKFE